MTIFISKYSKRHLNANFEQENEKIHKVIVKLVLSGPSVKKRYLVLVVTKCNKLFLLLASAPIKTFC